MRRLREVARKFALVLMTLMGGQIIFGAPVFGVTNPTLTVNLTPPRELNLAPGHFSSTSGAVEIVTNNYTGYIVSLGNSDNATDLVNPDGNNLKIPTITLPEGSESITPSGFSHGYGISLNGVDYVPAPDSASSITLGSSSVAGTGNHDFYFGAEVESGTAVGAYTKTFVITAVVNNPQYSITYDANTTDAVSGMPSDVDAEISDGGTATLSEDTPTRSRYNFLGWDEDDSVTSDPTYAPGDTITLEPTQANSYTLYAIWESRGGSSNPSISGGDGTSSDPYIDDDGKYDPSTILGDDGYYSFPNVDGKPEVVVEGGEVVGFAYTDTSGVDLTTDGLDTGVLAFNGSDFKIVLRGSFPWTTSNRAPIVNLSGEVNGATSGFVLNNSAVSQTYTTTSGSQVSSSTAINRFRCFPYENGALNTSLARSIMHVSYPLNTSTKNTLGWTSSDAPLAVTVVVNGKADGDDTHLEIYVYSSYNSLTGTGTLLGVVGRNSTNANYDYTISGLSSSGITVQLGTYELNSGSSTTTLTYEFTVYEFSVEKASL